MPLEPIEGQPSFINASFIPKCVQPRCEAAGEFDCDAEIALGRAVKDAASACETIITDGVQKAMNLYNGNR